MKLEQIEKAIRNKTIVDFKFGGWGILTALSDNKSTVYYKKNGCGLFRQSTTIDQVEEEKPL